MKTAIIGYTGFVGQNISNSRRFDAYINSSNISQHRGAIYDKLVIAVGDARKWYANKYPVNDRLHVEKIVDDVTKIRANQVIVISTVDVLPFKSGNEDQLIDVKQCDTYGRNRYFLEECFRQTYTWCTTIRLPGLYGPALKKNLIFDLINNRDLNAFNPFSEFQWFNMLKINDIIDFVEKNNIKLLHVCSQPLSVRDTLAAINRVSVVLNVDAPIVKYDVRTVYSSLFGLNSCNYLYDTDEVLSGIKKFLG